MPSPLNVAARLEALRALRAGWLDGEGRPLDRVGLDWLAVAFGQRYPDTLPRPHLYPTPDGQVQAEWTLGTHEISLTVDLVDHRGEWHRTDMASGEEECRLLNLDDPGDWVWLADAIRCLADSGS